MDKLKSLFSFWATGPDAPRIEDQEQVDRSYRKIRRGLVVFLTLGYGTYYVCRLALSVIKKPLIDNGIFTAEELGQIGSALFFGYAAGKITNGFLSDHTNTRRFMVTGLMVSAICNIVMGFSTALTVFTVMWALNGWFQSFGAASSVVTLSRWFSNSERGVYYGIWSSSHSIGEGLTYIGTAFVVAAFGWRAGFIGAGAFGLAFCILLAIFIKDRPQTLGLPAVADWRNDHIASTRAEGASSKQSPKEVLAVQLGIFKHPAVWVLGLASASMYVTRYAVDSWGILYLQESRGLDLKSAGTLLGINTLAGIGGSIAYGFISDKLFNARRPPVNLIFALIEISALIVIYFVPNISYPVLAVAYAVYGFTLAGLLAVLGGLFAVDVVSKKATGAVLGFIGIFSYMGAGIQEQVSGWLIGRASHMVDGSMVYDFTIPRLFWVGMAVVSMLLAVSLWNAKAED
jgi:OPA family sugar phosphate sensor protein UhpC-like MFS transporter